MQPAYRRGNSFQAVYAKLESPGVFQDFKDRLTTDPRLNVKFVRQTDYYAEQSTMIYNLITRLGTLVAGLMGVGAVFGALNTMYSAVSSRTREIATLRALGFSGGPVVVSVLLEALVLALVGGIIGAGLAYFVFDGFRAATINWQSFSQVAFAFDVTPRTSGRGNCLRGSHRSRRRSLPSDSCRARESFYRGDTLSLSRRKGQPRMPD